MSKKEFTRRLLMFKRQRKAREARAAEREYNSYTVENCVRSMDIRRKYLNGKRCY